jgi:hypothetical protein
VLRELQERLLAVLADADPVAALTRLLADPQGLTDEDVTALRQIDADGLRLTALIVVKLRFERLTLAVPELAALFAEQPEEFVQLFREYAAAVPATAYFPSAEATLFREWYARRELRLPSDSTTAKIDGE